MLVVAATSRTKSIRWIVAAALGLIVAAFLTGSLQRSGYDLKIVADAPTSVKLVSSAALERRMIESLETPPPRAGSWISDFSVAPDALWPPELNISAFIHHWWGGGKTWRDEIYEWDNTTGTLDKAGHRYPITAAQFARGYSPPNAAMRCRWALIAAGLEAGKSVRIGVLGGSMTAGLWPTYLDGWLRVKARTRGFNISVTNIALGGQFARGLSTNACVKVIGGYDAYIIDTGVNAMAEKTDAKLREGMAMLLECLLKKRGGTASLPAPLPPALLYAESFDVNFGAPWESACCPQGPGVFEPIRPGHFSERLLLRHKRWSVSCCHGGIRFAFCAYFVCLSSYVYPHCSLLL
jgi:hypothetical protein